MSFEPKLGETITVRFVTSGLDGGVKDATSLPTCEVLEDGDDAPVFAPTVVKRAGKTGEYNVPVPLITANGFEAGKCYNVMGYATVDGKSASGKLESFLLREYSVDGVNVLEI